MGSAGSAAALPAVAVVAWPGLAAEPGEGDGKRYKARERERERGRR